MATGSTSIGSFIGARDRAWDGGRSVPESALLRFRRTVVGLRDASTTDSSQAQAR